MTRRYAQNPLNAQRNNLPGVFCEFCVDRRAMPPLIHVQTP